MEKGTVKRRIYLSNMWMVFVTLALFLGITLLLAKAYGEFIEQDLKDSVGAIVDKQVLEQLIAEYTIRKHMFLLLIFLDGILCIAGLVLVSQLFTKNLVGHIMAPLQALAKGAERIQENVLTEDIVYQGDREFEQVCETFNAMRTSLLAEQEKNMAYEKARTDMIAGISHDLRTPLTAIKGTIKGLLDGVAATSLQQEKFLSTAYKRAGEMEILLNQLFYLSKLETGNMPLTLEEVPLAALIELNVKRQQERIKEETAKFTCEVQPDDKAALLDREQFSRIFDNLTENSIKYAQVSPLLIEIKEEQEDGFLKVSFHDNGVGVSKEKLAHVFEEFYRADESRNQKEGNGLGLYIVKHLVEAMGGHVTASSEEGFLVELYFPLVQQEGE